MTVIYLYAVIVYSLWNASLFSIGVIIISLFPFFTDLINLDSLSLFVRDKVRLINLHRVRLIIYMFHHYPNKHIMLHRHVYHKAHAKAGRMFIL